MLPGPSTSGVEPSWKRISLSLERPYKDDHGESLPILFDITPEGERIYEPKETSSARLKDHLHRIFVERGLDFFELTNAQVADKEPKGTANLENGPLERKEYSLQPMNTEELYAMRMEILPQLFVALGEMSHAKELLNSLLTSSSGAQSPSQTSAHLSATLVKKPPPIISVEAFNAQLTVGGKDEALRKASFLFKSEADVMERSRAMGERYWVDALRIRRANWGLIPAPLPLGSATGKGADRTSKDFLISYGLEGSSPIFKRKAIASIAHHDASNEVIYPHRQHTRLRISVLSTSQPGTPRQVRSATLMDENTLDGSLRIAQQEIVEQEIFTLLSREAGNLPTASARVSERLIAIDVAQSAELRFELVETAIGSQDIADTTCDLIYHGLHILLLRRHAYAKLERVGATGVIRNLNSPSSPPPILQPIIDFLQYTAFCERLENEISKSVRALTAMGVSAVFVFRPVGETGPELLELLCERGREPTSGEALIRINSRHTVRLTFTAPSSLTAHLSQTTIILSSIPQLSQMLMDEIERSLLQCICDLGREKYGGTWFIDMNRCVARWEGCILSVTRIAFFHRLTQGLQKLPHLARR
ncbi:uncharacterized protein LACBIDRAFT_311839 [Laccaria bicolor S238N-H82]|uniref:Mediator of RNA polymerase II transcription subunit 17 n=1 Tax=Laccaria bicolor (strain S238N-H82 / ATCC MYA-4686) TaxID=486041 RepID=B0CYE8_LACBS|nr:uncharacterized protein LACBIDRAFT_311839 [Laccaria bicolor S238N-H82]EDR12871.1 predicted protein [Laccaria bicolor S238N-H82]|eukprot:XP_001877135.1 predicted protein [Laccaria bicolor S238N-H82]